MADDLQELTQKLLKFRDERDWSQFHTPRSLAESLVLEAAEVLEVFQWKTDQQVKEYLQENEEELSHEIADVLIYLLFLAEEAGIDPLTAVEKKMQLNAKNYPVEKAKGSAKKYTEY